MLTSRDLGENPPYFEVQSKFIVVEGIDGSGKSTLVHRLPEVLGLSVLGADPYEIVYQPGYTFVAEKIRAMLKDPDLSIHNRTRHMLLEAARIDLLTYMKEKQSKFPYWFISDRHVDSTWAYQSEAEGVPASQVQFAQMAGSDLPKPDVTIFLDVHRGVAKQRILSSRSESQLDMYDKAGDDFFFRVQQNYYKRILKDRTKYLVVDGNLSSDLVLQYVRNNLKLQVKPC